jgi:PncC family amidohydrolase
MSELKKLIAFLQAKKLTVAAAESVSGGYLSYLLTKIPGSSKVFRGSVVAYSSEIKREIFKISPLLLKKTQGVSNAVSILLAKKAKKFFKVDLAVSLVGFASYPARHGIKPGMIFIAVADGKGVASKKILIKGSRDYVRKKASLAAIELIYGRVNSEA